MALLSLLGLAAYQNSGETLSLPLEKTKRLNHSFTTHDLI